MVILISVALTLMDRGSLATQRFAALDDAVEGEVAHSRLRMALLEFYRRNRREARPIVYEQFVGGPWGAAALRFERPKTRRLDWKSVDSATLTEWLRAQGIPPREAETFVADAGKTSRLMELFALPSSLAVLPRLAERHIRFGAVFAGADDKPAGSSTIDLATATPDALTLMLSPSDAASILAARATARVVADLTPSDLSATGRQTIQRFLPLLEGDDWRVSLEGRFPMLITLDFSAKTFNIQETPQEP